MRVSRQQQCLAAVMIPINRVVDALGPYETLPFVST